MDKIIRDLEYMYPGLYLHDMRNIYHFCKKNVSDCIRVCDDLLEKERNKRKNANNSYPKFDNSNEEENEEDSGAVKREKTFEEREKEYWKKAEEEYYSRLESRKPPNSEDKIPLNDTFMMKEKSNLEITPNYEIPIKYEMKNEDNQHSPQKIKYKKKKRKQKHKNKEFRDVAAPKRNRTRRRTKCGRYHQDITYKDLLIIGRNNGIRDERILQMYRGQQCNIERTLDILATKVTESLRYYTPIREQATEFKPSVAIDRDYQRPSFYNKSYDSLMEELSYLEDKKQPNRNVIDRINKIKFSVRYMKFEKANYNIMNYSWIDLHGLTVENAIFVFREFYERFKKSDERITHVIVGKGLHSKNKAQIRPAIIQLLRKEGIGHNYKRGNYGVVIIPK